MKREIKFKAKSLETSEWVYGSYLNLGMGLHFIKENCHCVLKDNFGFYTDNLIQIDPETLCQCIGYNDVVFADIYEGDLFRDISDTFYWQIYWNVFKSAYWVKSSFGLEEPFANIFSITSKIEGNIIDNKELFLNKKEGIQNVN